MFNEILAEEKLRSIVDSMQQIDESDFTDHKNLKKNIYKNKAEVVLKHIKSFGNHLNTNLADESQ